MEPSHEPTSPLPPPRLRGLGLAALVLATVLWGSTYVVLKSSLDAIPPSALTFSRFALSTLLFLPLAIGRSPGRWTWGGVELGLWLTAGYGLQTVALQYTTASRTAFVSALYVVFLPLGLALLGRPLPARSGLAAGLAFGGVGLLAYDGAPPNWGDFWSGVTALFWAAYIGRLEFHAARGATRTLALQQAIAVTVAAGIWMAIADGDWLHWDTWTAAAVPWGALLYLGFLATAATVWLQAWGQRFASAPVAAVTYTLEPVFATLLAAVALQERLGPRGLAGVVAILGAIALLQWPQRRRSRGAAGASAPPNGSDKPPSGC